MTSGNEGDISVAGGPAGLVTGEGDSPAGTNWRRRAACREADPALFFPKSPRSKRTREALGICKSCPVRNECAELALARPDIATFGVWGGMTEWERFPRRIHPSGRQSMQRPVLTHAETKARVEKAQRYAAEGMSHAHIAVVLRVSRRTVLRYLAAA